VLVSRLVGNSGNRENALVPVETRKQNVKEERKRGCDRLSDGLARISDSFLCLLILLFACFTYSIRQYQSNTTILKRRCV
jgi:hypothetical protein